jgi:hypothetical protein
MDIFTVTDVELARMRAEGTVCRCLDCAFIGIGRMTTYHTMHHRDHKLVPECRECHADLIEDAHAPTCSFSADYYQPPVVEVEPEAVEK